MARPFEFTPKTKKEAWERQNGNCACCNKSLEKDLKKGNRPEAHHVIPDQAGNPNKKDHQFLKSTDNCAYVCRDCHLKVHDEGNFRRGPVEMPDKFKYSHQGDKKAHSQWANDLNKNGDVVARDNLRDQYQSARQAQRKREASKSKTKTKTTPSKVKKP